MANIKTACSSLFVLGPTHDIVILRKDFYGPTHEQRIKVPIFPYKKGYLPMTISLP